MRFVAVAVVGLAGWMAASGVQAQQVKAPEPQIPTEQQKKAMVILQQRMGDLTPGSLCPGILSARRQGVGGTVWTTALEDRNIVRSGRPTGLGVHVEFEHRGSPVKALEMRVGYLPPGLRLMPVAGDLRSDTEREKTFDLDRVAAERIDGDLLVGAAATITRVRLVSVTYADGNVWREPTENACVATPNGYLPVGGR